MLIRSSRRRATARAAIGQPHHSTSQVIQRTWASAVDGFSPPSVNSKRGSAGSTQYTHLRPAVQTLNLPLEDTNKGILLVRV